MKIIQSAGGPLVGLNRGLVDHWGGVAGKIFVGENAPFANDYEAASDLISGVGKPPCNIAKISGTIENALLISMPMETSLIEADGSSAYIAQVHYADEGWSFEMFERREFDKVVFDEEIFFDARAGVWTFFDAAYSADTAGSDCINFELTGGSYIFSSGAYEPDPSTYMVLYRIIKAD